MDWKIVAAALLVTTSATSGVLGAPPNDPPEADAGLDQRVTAGTTVLLDGTGSRDPDGKLTDYDWRIETPAGDSMAPDCTTCERTRFRATTEGVYNVTLTVTDEDGATRTDSLYVTVTPDDALTVDLAGPTRTTPNATVTFQADITPGSEPTTDVTWSIDGSPTATRNTTTISRTFQSQGERKVTVTVTDAIGRTSTDSLQVAVEESDSSPSTDDSNESDPGESDPNEAGPDESDTNESEPNEADPDDTDTNESDPNEAGPDESDTNESNPNETDSSDPDDSGRVVIEPDTGNESDPEDPGSENEPTRDNEPSTPNQTADDGDSDGSETNQSGTLASIHDPTVAGPQLVTGDEPLEATYAIEINAPPGDVARIRWIANDDQVATVSRIDASWRPGRHTLQAKVTYTDDSTETATFEDGTSTVVADPAPEPTLNEPTVDRGEVTGSFDVDDEYGNLAAATVTIDGTTVFNRRYSAIRRLQPSSMDGTYRLDGLLPNENYTITLTATDERGQTRTATRTIRPENRPEVISIGFREDTVDAYHPRINNDRYTATHVVKIQLNEYAATNVTSSTSGLTEGILPLDEGRRAYNKRTDVLTIKSTWSGNSPENYFVSTSVRVGGKSILSTRSGFTVTPSPPELRLTSPTEGTKRVVQNWGMVIDASRSFDPDGHDIDLEWRDGARELPNRPWAAKLTPTDTAGVVLEDATGATTSELGSFLPYYVPRIADINETTNGPYNESEQVTLEVWTAPYAFTKNTKRYSISLGARTNSSDVDIVSMTKRKVPTASVEGNPAIKHRLHRWVATVRVTASELNEGEDWVTLYNEENPQRIYVSEDLDDVDIHFESKKRNVGIERTAYRVRNESGRERVQVTERDRYVRMTRGDWSLIDERQSVDAVSIETRRTESHTVTRSKRFDTPSGAKKFATAREDWAYTGAESYEKTKTVVISKWTRNSSLGRPTGETRRVVSNPNAYVKQTEFQYFTTQKATETREVTKRIPVTVPVERTVGETTCRRPVACYRRPRTVIEWKTKYVERTVEFEREITRRIEHSYWAKRARSPSHSSTGRTRQVRSEAREYHTEYLVNVREDRTVTKHRYGVSKTVQKTREEWSYLTEVDSFPEARALTTHRDERIGHVEKSKQWILAKSVNTTDVVRTYEDEDDVLKTYATVTGTLVYGPQPSQRTKFRLNIELEGIATKQEILDRVENHEFDCDPETEDCNA